MLYMNPNIFNGRYPMVKSNLHFENFDQTDLIKWTHRSNQLIQTWQFWMSTTTSLHTGWCRVSPPEHHWRGLGWYHGCCHWASTSTSCRSGHGSLGYAMRAGSPLAACKYGPVWQGSTSGSGRSPTKCSKLHRLRVWSWGWSHTKTWLHPDPPHPLQPCPRWMRPVGACLAHLLNGLQQPHLRWVLTVKIC
jgi:hypothetical protein